MNIDVSDLKAIALRGCIPMFDPERRRFCYRLALTKDGLVRKGISTRYTIITLLGLRHAEAEELKSSIEIKPLLENLLKNTQWINNIGDLGLLLWLCALSAPERSEELARNLRLNRALDCYRDARLGRTMELAWFLSGLSHLALACVDKVPDLQPVALKSYALLMNNQGEKGIFGHNARNGVGGAGLRAHVGSFADQVYPIYALAKFGEAFNVPEAFEAGARCAGAICRAQGSRGEWWWHYSSVTGEIISRYPVYAVHQHGMGPMALLALGRALGTDYTPWICKGLQWLGGNNVLGFDMRDPSRDIIWRCIFQNQYKAWVDRWRAVVGMLESTEPETGLKVKFECRPYELGWLLYAFAGPGDVATKGRIA